MRKTFPYVMEPITGIILAGGKSSRMGTDKGLMPFRGKPMIQHIIDPMAKICQRIFIVTSNPMYGMFGFELVADEQPDYGPVMGVMCGLKKSETEVNLVMSCDAPFVGFDLMKQLVLASGYSDLVAASSSAGIHPLIAVYRQSCLPVFEQAVTENEHRMRTVIQNLSVKELNVENEELVRNINAQEDLKT